MHRIKPMLMTHFIVNFFQSKRLHLSKVAVFCLFFTSAFWFSVFARAQEAHVFCLEISVTDPNATFSGYYESIPGSTHPNTINLCSPTTLELSDINSSSGRCFVPAESRGITEWYLVYVMTSSPAAARPVPGTVLPQASGPWNIIIDPGNIRPYDQIHFPPLNPGAINSFTPSASGSYAIVGAICKKLPNNQFEVIVPNTTGTGSVVSNKIFLNYINPLENVNISGNQLICNGLNETYTLPASIASLNPVWTVTGGTFTGSGSQIQVTWNSGIYQGQVQATVQLLGGTCVRTFTLPVYGCCGIGSTPQKLFTFINSLSQTVLSGTGTLTASPTGIQEIFINGTFLIDQNFTFNGISFLFGPLSKILIADGVEVHFNNSEFDGNICHMLFDGLYVTNPSQRVVFNNSRVWGASNGLVSLNGGRIEVINSQFSGSYLSLQVLNYNPETVANYNSNVSPVQVYGSMFNSYSGQVTPMHTQTRPTAAIKIENCGFVRIGNPSQSPNTFTPGGQVTSYTNPIRIINSGAHLVNNHFEKTFIISSPSETAAIWTTTSAYKAWMRPLQIGQSLIAPNAAEGNRFSDGYQAIVTNGVPSVIIQGNQIQNYSFGIAVINANTQRVINRNGINQNHELPAPTVTNVGIAVSSTHGLPNGGGSVSENVVEAAAQAISLVNVNSLAVTYNTIKTNSAPGVSQTSVRAGIHAVNGWNLNIYRNDLQHNILPLNSNVSGNNLRGISLNNVVDAFVWDNYILRYGSGIYAANSSKASQFRCNYLQASIWGFNFNNVRIDQQGNAGDPTDNQWVANRRAERMTGTEDPIMQPTTWFYRSGAAFSPLSTGSLFFTTPQLTSGGSVECSQVSEGGEEEQGEPDKYNDPEVVEEVLADVVGKGAPVTQTAVQYFGESMAYRVMADNPALQQQLASLPAGFSNFYFAQQATKGEVKRLYDALQGRSSEDGGELLASFVPSNIFEAKIAEVNAIYANSWAMGRYQLDSAERMVLLQVAQADALLWGEAVYTARVMLGMYEMDENYSNSQNRMALNEEVLPELGLSTAYPNPTTGEFWFTGSIETGLEKAHIELYDLQGRSVAQPEVHFNEGWHVADPKLEPGIYFYRLWIDGKEMQRGKIIFK